MTLGQPMSRDDAHGHSNDERNRMNLVIFLHRYNAHGQTRPAKRGSQSVLMTVCALALSAADFCATPGWALEVDCAAADFCRGRKDLADELTARIQRHRFKSFADYVS